MRGDSSKSASATRVYSVVSSIFTVHRMYCELHSALWWLPQKDVNHWDDLSGKGAECLTQDGFNFQSTDVNMYDVSYKAQMDWVLNNKMM